MRIDPQRDTLPSLRPAASAAASTRFASALAGARSAVDPSLPEAADPSHAGEVPIAQRWGEYGPGATAEGYGASPDAAQFHDVPIGPDEPASPLNPSGVTTTPGFTVEGYTARGTPVPPGFYNIAYYNWYLRDGGTPLEGFPQLADGATITETYGKFGDGATRATSFIPAAPDGGDGAPPTGTDATLTDVATGTVVSTDVTDALDTARARSAAPPASAEAATTTSTTRGTTTDAVSQAPSAVAHTPRPTSALAAPPAVVADPSGAATRGTGSGAAATPANGIEATLRAELTTLLRDLLRA